MYRWWSRTPPEVEEKRAKTLLHHFSADGKNDDGLTFNPFVGCAHRCVYCYAKYEWTPNFYDTIVIRTNADNLLKRELEGWKESSIDPVFLSSATDCYQPIEGKYRLTRRCVDILQEHNVPYYIFTKSSSIVRDLDLHARYKDKCIIVWSITTLDEKLKRALEPNASTARGMLKALEIMSRRGITTGVNIDPIIPGLTDDRQGLEELVRQVACRGGRFVAASFLRLRSDIWDRMQSFLQDLKREDLIQLFQLLYFETPLRDNGYFVPRPDYTREVLEWVRRTAMEKVIPFGFPLQEHFVSQCSTATLQPKKIWEQQSLPTFQN